MQTVLLAIALLAAPAARTINGSFTVVYAPDDGTRTTQPLPAADGTTVSAYSWNKATGGYDVHAGTIDASGNVTIPGVPEGHYFLAVNNTDFFGFLTTSLTELTTSKPDLSTIVSVRPDMATDDGSLTVNLNLTGLDPYVPRKRGFGQADSTLFQLESSQNLLGQRPFEWGMIGKPVAGATSKSGQMSWSSPSFFGLFGLPDASRGDVVFAHSAQFSIIGGAGAQPLRFRAADRAARLSLTLQDGAGTPPFDVALEPIQTSGQISGDVRYSQFEALAPQVYPTAVHGEFGLTLWGIPHTTRYPDAPNYSGAQLSFGGPPPMLLEGNGILDEFAPPLTDANYGALTYGKFLDGNWRSFRQTLFAYEVFNDMPGGWQDEATAYTFLLEPEGGDDDDALDPNRPIQPVLGPVQSPQIGGVSAFVAQDGVGTTPTLSWTAPTLGQATSYTVYIWDVNDFSGSAIVTALVRSTSFTVPDGLLIPGELYYAVITANSAPWDHPNAGVYRTGFPLYTTDCVTAGFTP
jgi:hypothetical protein